jgi:ATP-dependent 26S proteasome regulatory subunit
MTTTTTKTAGAACAADISVLLRARNPLIWLVTREEARAERIVVEAATSAQYVPMFWDCASGISNIEGPVNPGAFLPETVLATIRDSGQRSVWIMRDLPAVLKNDPISSRALRSLCRTLPQTARDNARAIVILTPSAEVPPELAGHAIVIDVPLPDRTEVAELLDDALNRLTPDVRETALPDGNRDKAIDAALGLSEEEVQSTFSASLIKTRTICPAIVAGEKKRIIARERVLEWHDPHPAGLDGVGGLENLKEWLVQRRDAFSQEARDYGLPSPKGVFLGGVTGCGKSLTAKAVAAAWGMPLLRLDMGALQSKWIGESQTNIRKAFKTAEAVAPCVLWADEIDKALDGAGQGAADGGVSSDALGTLLTWMEERPPGVFVVATANDVAKLPPELLGRFDERFFIDLPSAQERIEVIRAALAKHGRNETLIDINATVAATDGFTGREIAALVPDAMFVAFADGKRALTTSDLRASAERTSPLSKTQPDRIKAQRAWGATGARPANRHSIVASANVRALDL